MNCHVDLTVTQKNQCAYNFTPEQHAAASGCSVDLLNACVDGGTSSAGFFVKNPSGFNMTLTRSIGMTGKSSIRGLCVRPKAMNR
jgi:hypothetical protein